MCSQLRFGFRVFLPAAIVIGGASWSDAQDDVVASDRLVLEYTQALLQRMGSDDFGERRLPEQAIETLQDAIDVNLAEDRPRHAAFNFQLKEKLEGKEGPPARRLALVLLDTHQDLTKALPEADLSDEEWASIRLDDTGKVIGPVVQVRLPWPICIIIGPDSCEE